MWNPPQDEISHDFISVRALRDCLLYTSETHKLIAEALLKYETLDSVQIKSLYETGKMPENSEHELEEEAKPLSYDEIKSKLEENN